MKFILKKIPGHLELWNGKRMLPDEVNVISNESQTAEIELLCTICNLHGYMTAFDLITGADSDTEKDADINAVLSALQMYIYPKMPISNYTNPGKRQKPLEQIHVTPIDLIKNK
jgi:hypothetical protein